MIVTITHAVHHLLDAAEQVPANADTACPLQAETHNHNT
jgi:hypothetical protein